MVALPNPTWIPLQKAPAFVAELSKCELADARAALLQAFREGTLIANGFAPTWSDRDERLAWMKTSCKAKAKEIAA